MIGDRLGKWVIFKEIGRGGMGTVFLAREEIGGRQAAIKVLSPELSQDPGFLERFKREMDILAGLSHPGVVQFYEGGLENGVYFYAMEHVEGQSLDDIVHQQGRLPWAEVLAIASQVAPALRHVHDHGVIHRDIKPSNLLITPEGKVKLTDFGIAKVFAATHLTATGGVVGTAEYLSPEQAAGKTVGKRSDLYSLGVLLYHLIVGKPPFQGKTMVDLLHKHLYSQFDPPGRWVPDLPEEIDELICQLMAKDPKDRPADALVLSKQLDRIARRLEKKSNPTFALADDPATLAENSRARRGPAGPGPATLMSRMVREELENQAKGGPLYRFLNRFWVLFPLFLVCVGLLVWTFWPLSQETLYSRGSELMETGRLADMERAWRDYLEPLNERFPDHPYQARVAQFKSLLEAARSPQISEGERFFLLGENLLEKGDAAGAARTWNTFITAFQLAEAEREWVRKARAALADLVSPERVQRLRGAAKPALDRAAALNAAGDHKGADTLLNALEELYRGDPGASELLRDVERARKK